MSQTSNGLVKGAYAYCSHSLLLAGDIAEVFRGKFVPKTKDDGAEASVLQKFPIDDDVEGSHLMCVLKLRRPISLDDYRSVHHQSIRPMVQQMSDDVQMLLLRAEMLCTIPDGM